MAATHTEPRPRREASLGKRFRFWRPVRWLRKFALREPLEPAKLRLYWTVLPYTMCTRERLANAYDLAFEAGRRGVPGALVECGVFKGGCSAVMAAGAARSGVQRISWLFDSFEGLPEPTAQDGEEATVFADGRSGGKLAAIDRNVASQRDVEELFFEKLAMDRDRVRIVQGWFQETLPAMREAIGPVAVLRLDADWYESTRCCLEQLYDAVVPGGYVILDDYGRWEGCRRAWDEFAAERRLAAELHWVDAAGVWLAKPAGSARAR
jgi:hypothetical protein